MGYLGGNDDFASALNWWAEAGVDVLIDEAPRNWLAKPAPARSAASEQDAAADATPAPPALPATLDAFVAWRSQSADVPEARWGAARVMPVGPATATLMVLVDQPAGGELLGEAERRLLERMLAAIGLTIDAVHLATVAWAEPLVKPPAAERSTLEALTRHHVALTKPRALLALGDAASRAVTTTNAIEARGRLHPLNHEGGSTQLVVSYHPRILLQRPLLKAQSWADLLLLKRVLST